MNDLIERLISIMEIFLPIIAENMIWLDEIINGVMV